MKRCPYCGEEVRENAAVCPSCHADLQKEVEDFKEFRWEIRRAPPTSLLEKIQRLSWVVLLILAIVSLAVWLVYLIGRIKF